MQQQTRAYGMALAAVFLWSTVATAFKLSLRNLTPTELLLFSTFVATVTLGAFLGAQRKLGALRHFSLKDYSRSALAGFLNPFLYYTVLFQAYSLLPGQEAQPLNYTWAIALALLSIPLLGQKLRPAGVCCRKAVQVVVTSPDHVAAA